MRISRWLIVISILMLAGLLVSGCATVRSAAVSADRWLSVPVDHHPNVVYHGPQPVIFANLGRGQLPADMTLIIGVRNVLDPKVWVGRLTLGPHESALVYYKEGRYEWIAWSQATEKRIASGKVFVPACGRPYVFNGDRYAAGVVLGGSRR